MNYDNTVKQKVDSLRNRFSLFPTGKAKKSFTLIELLVVISIIAILAGMLLPALGKARDMAYKISCNNNLGHIGKAMLMYANDYQDFLPPYRSGSAWGVPGNREWYTGSPNTGLLAEYLSLNQSEFDIGMYGHASGNTSNRIGRSKISCPVLRTMPAGSAKVYGYGYNTEINLYGRRKLTRFQTPSKTLLVSEINASVPHADGGLYKFSFRHNYTVNAVFAGGNTSSVHGKEIPVSHDDIFWKPGPNVPATP